MPTVNFDANATHSVLPEVKQALMALPGECLNPSSVHRGGQRARALIDGAREQVRMFCGAPGGWRVIFTSGATEANNLAIAGVASALARRGRLGTVAATAIEHPSVLGPVRHSAEWGFEVQEIPPGPEGTFEPAAVCACISGECALLSIALANNETGQILPVAETADLLHSLFPGALVHCDAVQAFGRMAVDVERLGADLVSLSGHKLGALSGIGALLVREEVLLSPLLLGGAQEGEFRAGTENLFGIVSFGAACTAIHSVLAARIDGMSRRRDELWAALQNHASPVILNSWGTKTLPNTLNVRFPGIRADDLVVALDLEGICISAGPACAAGKPEPSHVLLAMGLELPQVRESVRISLEAGYGAREFERAVGKIIECVARLRRGRAAG